MGLINPAKLVVTGFEIKRSDSSFITKQVQTEIFKIILNGGKKQDIMTYINKIKEDIKNNVYNYDQIAIPKGIGKDIDDYTKIMPPQIKGIKYSEKYLNIKFQPRSKIKFIYVEVMPQPYPPTDVVSFERKEQLPQNIQINWKRQLPVLIDNQVERVLEALGLEGQSASLSGW